MKSKNNNKLVSSEKSEIKISNDKKTNVNVNTYMKKSKRNKENIENIENDIPIVQEVIPEIIENDVPDIKPNVKALNLIKAREARKTHLVNKNTEREQKILNLVNEFQQDEYLKLQNKTEKLKNKLMKLL
jgi:Txe/YoeB family toxin of Txe-Axe toxin-antitoxin module